MKTSTERILTTHTGSLPRPADLTDRHDLGRRQRTAVAGIVRRQVDTGIDVVSDGEVSKPSYSTYVTDRLTGFEDQEEVQTRELPGARGGSPSTSPAGGPANSKRAMTQPECA